MLKCVVIPLKGREILGILPNNKRISEETVLCLNKREILKCMKNASVYGIREDGTKILLTDDETVNREIMSKVKERRTHELLDIVGLTEYEKREIKDDVKQYKPSNYNKNQKRKR